MWDRFWHFLIFAFIAYLMILFSIIVDLYWRDRRTPGLIKAIWVISSSSSPMSRRWCI